MENNKFQGEITSQVSIKTENEVDIIQDELKNSEHINMTIRWLEGIKDPTRYKLIYALFTQNHLCVNDLAKILKVSSSAISQHLRKLRDMELVCSHRQNQTLFLPDKGR